MIAVMDALALAGDGYAIVPIHSVSAGVCSCGHSDCQRSRGKHPRTEHGLDDATTDVAQIQTWWRRWPDSNIAIRTGEASHVWVLDIDPRNGGDRSLAELELAHGAIVTRRVHTGGGGWHLYFVHPGPGYQWRKSVALGLDIKADGGYVVAPPSTHLSGSAYEWLDLAIPIAPAPAWLLELATKRPYVPPIQQSTPRLQANSAYALRAFELEVRRVASTPEGNLNNTLNEAAFSLGQLVAAGALDQTAVARELLSAAISAGHPERGAKATILSGISAGEKLPRVIPQLVVGDYGNGPDAEGAEKEPEPAPIVLDIPRVGECALDLWSNPLPPPIPTGFPALDRLLRGGLRTESCYVLPGPPGRGKSALATQVSRGMSLHREIVYYTTELSMRQIIARLAAPALGKSWVDVWEWGPSEAARVLEVVRDMRIRVVEWKRDMVFRDHIRRVADAIGSMPAVVFDYLQHAARPYVGPGIDMRTAVAKLSRELADWALDYKSCALILSSTSRAQYGADSGTGEKSDAAFLGSGKDAGEIELDMRGVLYLEPLDEVEDGAALLRLPKHNFGPSGRIGVRLDGSTGEWSHDPTSTLSEQDKAIVQAVDSGARSGQQIIGAIGGRKQSVLSAIRNLVSIHILEGPPYTIVDQGK